MDTLHRLIGITLVSLIGTGCSFPDDAKAKAASDAKAVELKLAEAQLAFQTRVLALQLDVAKRCSERGATPEWVNGNVTCKEPPK